MSSRSLKLPPILPDSPANSRSRPASASKVASSKSELSPNNPRLCSALPTLAQRDEKSTLDPIPTAPQISPKNILSKEDLFSKDPIRKSGLKLDTISITQMETPRNTPRHLPSIDGDAKARSSKHLLSTLFSLFLGTLYFKKSCFCISELFGGI